MDNIQFWIYIAFAVIYFITKTLKKARTPQVPGKTPTSPLETENEPAQPISFEELLQEITGKKTLKEPKARESQWEKQRSVVENKYDHQDFENEGRKRVFADDESKRIYEESIKTAKSTDEDYFEKESVFNKWKKTDATNETSSSALVAEIKDMLNNSEDARKAIILSEILNRKY